MNMDRSNEMNSVFGNTRTKDYLHLICGLARRTHFSTEIPYNFPLTMNTIPGTFNNFRK
jgi:hypothetical protein